MTRFSCKVWPVLAVVAVVLVVSQMAHAQPEEGRRERGGEGRRFGGGFGMPGIRLATLDEVQEALELSDEQKTKVEEINDKFRDDFRKLLDDGPEPEAMRKLSQDASAKLAEVLDDDQEKRLRGISIQVMGAGAVVADPDLAKELNVTEEQKEKLRDASMENMRAMRDSFGEMRDLPEDQRRKKGEELRADANKKLLAVLTSDQQEQLEALKGEKVEIDMSQLRGPGRGGFGGRDGERGRGDRDRDRDRNRGDAESDSDAKSS
jgi:Spy/CpxP family protein refolding chaperone